MIPPISPKREVALFPYSDPTGEGALQNAGALQIYRELLHNQYHRFGTLGNSAFTLLEAFEELNPGAAPVEQTVEWRGFPITAQTTRQAIDNDRLRFQDEYVEWRPERDGQGRLVRVTFTTDFPEYFQAFAQIGVDALKAEIRRVIPGADPTDAELFGAGPNPGNQSGPTRAQRFLANLANNPWNMGPKGFLCLTQRFNTLGALFNLVGECGIVQQNVPASDVCSNVGGACGPGRNSDPAICRRVQEVARANFACSLKDPAGVVIRRLAGNWALNGQAIDINNPTNNQGLWTLSRNGRRGVLNIPNGLRLNSSPIATGAEVADNLFVGVDVVAVANAALPQWARTGSEQQVRGVVA